MSKSLTIENLVLRMQGAGYTEKVVKTVTQILAIPIATSRPITDAVMLVACRQAQIDALKFKSVFDEARNTPFKKGDRIVLPRGAPSPGDVEEIGTIEKIDSKSMATILVDPKYRIGDDDDGYRYYHVSILKDL